MNDTLPHFTITSHNVCGINALGKQAELAMFLSETQPAVLVMQEPKLNNTSQPPTMRHYHGIYFSHPNQNTGVIMYIHHTVSYHVMSHGDHATPYRPDSSSTVVGFVWLSSPLLAQPIILGGVYLSHSAVEEDVNRIALRHSSTSNLPVFLIGDFNSRHPTWDRDMQRAPQGLDKWVRQHIIPPARHAPLTLLNTQFHQSRKHHTHVNTSYPHAESVLDLAVTSHPDMVCDMRVITESMISSDHLPITISLRTQTSNMSEPSSRTRWKTDASDEAWDQFREQLQDPLMEWAATWASFNTSTSTRITQQQLDTCYQQLTHIITTRARDTIGTVRITGKHQEWWGRDPTIPRLHRVKQDAHSLYRVLQRRLACHPTNPTTLARLKLARTAWHKTRSDFEKAVRACRIQFYEELVASLDDGRFKLLWSVWKRVSGSPRIPMASVHDPNTNAPPQYPNSLPSATGPTLSESYPQQHQLHTATHLNNKCRMNM